MACTAGDSICEGDAAATGTGFALPASFGFTQFAPCRGGTDVAGIVA